METTQKDFGHPYEPYQIQSEMMTAIYDCISRGQIGIFESPTGIQRPLT
jgi:chromosome transmission fidelity protein 1